MQKHLIIPDFTPIGPTDPITAAEHGGRAKCMQRLVRLDLPVPQTVALSFGAVRRIAKGDMPDIAKLVAGFPAGTLLSVRPSSEDPDWGGPSAILNIGMNDATHVDLSNTHGHEAANAIYLRFIAAYAVHVEHLDPDLFDLPSEPTERALADMKFAYEEETDEPFPQDPVTQLSNVLRSMARAWEGTSARLLRQAQGAPADAGLGLVVQEMAFGFGPPESGSGVIQFIDEATGKPQITGRYLSQSQGREALTGQTDAIYLSRDPRGASLEDLEPRAFSNLIDYGDLCRMRLREEMQIEFVISGGELRILDAIRVPRSTRASVRVAVSLAQEGIIDQAEALMRVEPMAIADLLHAQVDPRGRRDVFAKGIAASPGAATGRLVFSARAAHASQSREEPCILARRETRPEDIRGMHASVGVLTERGGMTSHAAVIARGLGLPCVVGVSDIKLNPREKTLTSVDGRVFREGDVVTIDGTAGAVLAGPADLLEPALDDSFRTLLGWADEHRDIGVRVNADTAGEARVGRTFDAEGIGLCRTEHMFLSDDRLIVMREMIFADTPEDRSAVLARLLPMQRDDFARLFDIMHGLPVVIRLFDPPLHEFLPSNRDAIRDLAEAMDIPVSTVARRVEALSEVNPMLGMRGVRLGITVPEIYDIQARAIFEAAAGAAGRGAAVVPEIMIPLVSAKREVELIKARVDGVAAAVRTETGIDFDYHLGVMVETPRAALRADEIAQYASFLSFGTNDLTQMAYGLSRDDAGRFMNAYVSQGVFAEDPFHRLDVDGVGELLLIGAERGRNGRADVVLSLCGEHGGDPGSIDFCRHAGFDYVSCSPYRVPVARLAAARLAISQRIDKNIN